MGTEVSKNPVLVLGATGGQGGAVAEALLEAGMPVRALVRNAGSDHRLQQLDRRDLGRFVALLLRSGPDTFDGRRIELASDAPTPAQMGPALSAALGRPVEFAETPMWLVHEGSADMAAMWEFLRGDGYQVDIEGLRRDYPSVGWTSFAEWAQRTFA